MHRSRERERSPNPVGCQLRCASACHASQFLFAVVVVVLMSLTLLLSCCLVDFGSSRLISCSENRKTIGTQLETGNWTSRGDEEFQELHSFFFQPAHSKVSFRPTKGGEIKNRKTAAQNTIKILGFNVHLPEGIIGLNVDKEARFSRLADAIREFDIVGLVEIAPRTLRATLCTSLRGTHPHFLELVPPSYSPMRDDGTLLLSRFPMSANSQMHFVSNSGLDFFANKGTVFAAVEVTVGSMATKLDVFVTHLNVSDDEKARKARASQLVELRCFVQRNSSAGCPAIIMGDFNINTQSPESGVILAMLPGFVDSHRTLGCTEQTTPWGATIDYILFKQGTGASSSSVSLHAARVHRFELPERLPTHQFLSDHFAIETELYVVS